jgi:hypothetical protein
VALGYATELEPPMFRDPQATNGREPRCLHAITLLVGLLIGFTGGYAIGGRDKAAPVAPPAARAEKPASAPAREPAAAGKPYSEQQVAQQPPPSTPPVPAETPAPSAARSAAREATQGMIVVRSAPQGAGVTVNGRWRGRTPLTLDKLRFGPYTVRVVQPGFATAREEFTLSAAQPARTMNVRLRPSSAPPQPEASATPPAATAAAAGAGSIYVDSRPRGARVFIDGRAVGVTPLRLGDVPAGSHAIRLELPDHRPLTSTTRVSPGQEARFTASLDPIR